MFRSPAASLDNISNEYSGHDSFNFASTRLVCRRASLDWRVPITKDFLAGESPVAWDGGADIWTDSSGLDQVNEVQGDWMVRWAIIYQPRQGVNVRKYREDGNEMI